MFTTLFQNDSLKIESIRSWLKTPGEMYDQAQDEWVILLNGEAELEINTLHVTLRSGDYCLIPKHTLHRVRSTSQNALWLTVFSS
ncbi:cupin domain-containing protein [Sulfuricurvum sp.]|uniref:cupin domain-containing protein n=1 Tax=Sulfuricurvum sp. TaxID=2025608 RepID=UPI003C54B657